MNKLLFFFVSVFVIVYDNNTDIRCCVSMIQVTLYSVEESPLKCNFKSKSEILMQQ